MRWVLVIAASMTLSACTILNEMLTEYVVIVDGKQPDSVYLQFPDGQQKAAKNGNSFGVTRVFQQSYATGITLTLDDEVHGCELNIPDSPGYLQYTVSIDDNRCMLLEERAGDDAF